MAKYKVTVLMQPKRNNNYVAFERTIEADVILIEAESIVCYGAHHSPSDIVGIFPCSTTVVEKVL